MAVQRSALVLSVADCNVSFTEPLDLASSPTQLSLGGEKNGFIRGTVVGNWLLWVGFVAVAYGFALMRSRYRKLPLAACTDGYTLPGLLVVPFAFLLQPTVQCSTTLLVHSDGAGDIVIGAVSLAGIAIIITFIGVQLTTRFNAMKLPLDDEDDQQQLSPWQRTAVRLIAFLFADGMEWVDATPRFIARYAKIFEPCRAGMQCFVLYELLNCVVSGVLGGIMPSSDEGCKNVLHLLCVQAGIYVVALLLCRPYSARIDIWLAWLGAVCGFVICITVLVGSTESSIATATVLMYGSLFSVLMFIVDVIVLGRLHQRLPLLMQSLVDDWQYLTAAKRRHAEPEDHADAAEPLLIQPNLVPEDPPGDGMAEEAPEDVWRSAHATPRNSSIRATGEAHWAGQASPLQHSSPQLPVPLPARRSPVPVDEVPIDEVARQIQLHFILRALIPAFDPVTPQDHRIGYLVAAAVEQRGLDWRPPVNAEPRWH